jgi:hypothetical protein
MLPSTDTITTILHHLFDANMEGVGADESLFPVPACRSVGS